MKLAACSNLSGRLWFPQICLKAVGDEERHRNNSKLIVAMETEELCHIEIGAYIENTLHEDFSRRTMEFFLNDFH